MAEIVRMPKMSDTMTEGVVAKWHKKIGDTVKSGELVAEIETDKATMEFESYSNGTLLYIGVEEGKAVAVDGLLSILGKPGEDFASLLANEKPKEKAAPAVTAEVKAAPAPAIAASLPAPVVSQPSPAVVEYSSNGDGRVKASPLAKKLAHEKGIDVSTMHGSGDGGRIVKRDIETYNPALARATAPTYTGTVGKEQFTDVAVSQMRKTIARRLSESKNTAPHFYLTMDIDMDAAIQARTNINEVTGLKISYNDMVIKAVSLSLRQHPAVNSSWLGDVIRQNSHIHIGVAVAVEDGLLVPVVRFADGKSLSQINVEVKDFAQRARDKKLQPSDWEGNTFTISNLGMFDIEEFTAIINTPDACILAIGAIKQVPVVKNNAVVPGNVMRVTLSCDHRVVDGVVGSKFLQTFKLLMENPAAMLA